MTRPRLLVAAAIVALSLAACSSSGSAGTPYRQSADGQSQNQKALPAAASAAAVPAGGSQWRGEGGSSNPPALNVTIPEDAIVKTGLITVQVTDLDASIIKATDMIRSYGGYLAGSQRSNDAKSGIASVTFRVPVAHFEDALAEARKLGTKVLGEHTETTPVGSQIVDLEARIANLKASEKAVQAIMARASSIPDVLTVENRLSDVQGQIEQLTAQLTGLTDQAAYSTLTIQIQLPDAVASPSPTPGPWSANHELDQASAALVSVGQGTATIGIWLVVVILPIALGLILLLVLGLFSMRLGRRLAPIARNQIALQPDVKNPES